MITFFYYAVIRSSESESDTLGCFLRTAHGKQPNVAPLYRFLFHFYDKRNRTLVAYLIESFHE